MEQRCDSVANQQLVCENGATKLAQRTPQWVVCVYWDNGYFTTVQHQIDGSKNIDHDAYHLWVDTTSLSCSWPDTISVESAEFQRSITRPDIPFTLYVSDSYLLLVPRQVTNVHPSFPTVQYSPQRFRLQLSDHWVGEFKKKFNQEPKFSANYVDFGLEDDEVVVAALLDGSNFIPYWEFRTLLSGDNSHYMDESSDAKASFGIMKWDLAQAS